jgi:hypothetical protein
MKSLHALSRLKPETHCFLANEIARIAARKRFANPAHLDIDSTIQEPNMQYPSISNLLIKDTGMARIENITTHPTIPFHLSGLRNSSTAAQASKASSAT